jgi:two-component system phosphate regulon response regulator PhoB
MNIMQTNVLVVDDEKPIRDMVCFALRQSDFECSQASSAKDAYENICKSRPDIILLDWMLPDTSGIDFLKMLYSKELYQDIPIIMLTAKTEEHDKLKGFNAGCDDYITKPFSTRELVARIKAVMKRSSGKEPGAALTIGKLTLDPSSHRVLVDENQIQIGPTEFRLLKFFMTHTDRVYSRGQLLDYVWGETTYIEERTVDVHIRRLRMALEKHQMDNLIQTVRGAGYRLSAN